MEEGNIDRDRIVDDHLVPDEYFCPICQCLLWKPRASATCRHLFCQKCIRTWLENPNSGKRCPFRCEAYEERRCSPDVYSVLYHLNISCRNTPLGCTHIVPYTSLEEPENNECEYLTQRCSECEQLVLRSELDEHREIPGLCVPHPLRCVVCKNSIEKSCFMEHFKACWENRLGELFDETTRTHNAPIPMHNQPPQTSTYGQVLIQNWLQMLRLINDQRQMTRIPSNLIGADAVRQAREQNCGVFYHIFMMLTFILANGSKASFFILMFSFLGFMNCEYLILRRYNIFLAWSGIHTYQGCCLIMLFSYILNYGIRLAFQSISNLSIIYFFTLFIFLRGCSLPIPIDVFEMNSMINMTKLNIFLYCAGLLTMEIILLLCRFYYWLIPTYLIVGIMSWINFLIAFQARALVRDRTQVAPVQTMTAT
jgi:hypothetical protein